MAYTKVWRSGNILEVYEYEKEPIIYPVGYKKRKARKVRAYDQGAHERRADSIRRLKSTFTRLVRSHLYATGVPAFVTLTMYQALGVTEAWSAFFFFIRNLKYRFGGSISYVTVLEFQKRGAPHFHTLIWGLSDDVVVNELPWSVWASMGRKKKKIRDRFVAYCVEKGINPETARGDRLLQNLWQRGFVDCLPTDGSPRLIGYLSKYMSKAMHDERLWGRKAYSVSRNVVRPLLSKITETFDDVALGYLDDDELTPLQVHEFDTEWLGKGRYRLYKVKPIN